tara:strand:+ start:709 stop:1443 length:735 start_codon:yes stop_codon:yes gene_type:complete
MKGFIKLTDDQNHPLMEYLMNSGDHLLAHIILVIGQRIRRVSNPLLGLEVGEFLLSPKEFLCFGVLESQQDLIKRRLTHLEKSAIISKSGRKTNRNSTIWKWLDMGFFGFGVSQNNSAVTSTTTLRQPLQQPNRNSYHNSTVTKELESKREREEESERGREEISLARTQDKTEINTQGKTIIDSLENLREERDGLSHWMSEKMNYNNGKKTIDNLINYCESTGKTYLDYGATAKKWAREDRDGK